MHSYEVGKIYPELRGPEGIRFDMTDGGAVMLIRFNSPQPDEIQHVRKGNIEFGLFQKSGIIFMLTKFVGMNWMDAPYIVHLSKNLTDLGEIEEGQGYNCQIFLVDAITGEMKVIRLIGFSTKFSRKLKEMIEEQKKLSFDIKEYEANLKKVFQTYTTKQMAEYTDIMYKVRG